MSVCLFYFRGIKISRRTLVYFGVFPAGFDLCLQTKSVFLVGAILDGLSREDSWSCF